MNQAEKMQKVSNSPQVYDDVLIDPHGYRAAALEQQFGSFVMFNGIACPAKF